MKGANVFILGSTCSKPYYEQPLTMRAGVLVLRLPCVVSPQRFVATISGRCYTGSLLFREIFNEKLLDVFTHHLTNFILGEPGAQHGISKNDQFAGIEHHGGCPVVI